MPMHMLLGLAGQGGTQAAFTVSYTDSAVSTANATSYTFSGRAVGTAAPDRLVVVGVGLSSPATGNSITAVTIGGVSATAISAFATNNATGPPVAGAQIWACVLGTGTTADIVVTISASSNSCGIGVWSVTGGAPLAPSYADEIAGSGTFATMHGGGTPDIGNTGGVVIGYTAVTGVAARTAIWDAPMVKNFDGVVETVVTHTGASALLVATMADYQVNLSGTLTSRATASVIWNP